MSEDRTAYCVEGCGRPVTTSRPLAVTRDGDPISELVCWECVGSYCSTCGLPIPIDSTPGPDAPLQPCEPTMCLLDHGPPTLTQRWRRWRERRNTLRANRAASRLAGHVADTDPTEKPTA